MKPGLKWEVGTWDVSLDLFLGTAVLTATCDGENRERTSQESNVFRDCRIAATPLPESAPSLTIPAL